MALPEFPQLRGAEARYLQLWEEAPPVEPAPGFDVEVVDGPALSIVTKPVELADDAILSKDLVLAQFTDAP
jgi:hypothetical protein